MSAESLLNMRVAGYDILRLHLSLPHPLYRCVTATFLSLLSIIPVPLFIDKIKLALGISVGNLNQQGLFRYGYPAANSLCQHP